MNTPKQKSRGVRNRNPLNIRRSTDLWQGLAERQPDPEFFTFKSMAWGYRAAFIVLRTYCHKYGINTIRGIASRWAPPEDGNDTRHYMELVSGITHLAPDQPLNPYNPEHMGPIVAAMSRIENGCQPNMDEVRKGWAMYMGTE